MANILTLNEVAHKAFTTRKDRKEVVANPKGFLKQDRVGITQVVPFMYYYAPVSPDKIGVYGSHQFGTAFGPSPETVVMPSRKRLEESGNPYVRDVNSVENVGATSKFCEPPYKNFAVFQYHAWEYLTSGASVNALDLYDNTTLVEVAQEDIKRQTQKEYKFNRKSTSGNLFLYQIMHMLRDLEFCGLMVATKEGQRTTKSKFAMQQVVFEAIAAHKDKDAKRASAKAAKDALKAAQPAKAPKAPKAPKAAPKAAKSLLGMVSDMISGKTDDTTKVEDNATKEVDSTITRESVIQDIIDDKEFIKS